MVTGEIAIPEKNATALRGMLQQISTVNAQMQGAVNALALAYDVPADWRFDTERMVFAEPPQAQGTPIEEGEATAQIAQ